VCVDNNSGALSRSSASILCHTNSNFWSSLANSASVARDIMSVNQDTRETPDLSICIVYRVCSEDMRSIACAPLRLKFSTNVSVQNVHSADVSLRKAFFVAAGTISLYQLNACRLRQFCRLFRTTSAV
jgi:hypothetical protein